MKRISFAVSVGLVAGLVGLSAQTAPTAQAGVTKVDRTVTVTGCVAKGTEVGTYTLTSAKTAEDLASSPSPTTAGTAGTAGTEKSASMEHSASYRLKGEDLSAFVGQQVEVTGTTGDDKRTDKGASTGTTATVKEARSTVTVQSVKMLSSTCP
jgi:hypothetical protein